MSVGTCDYLYLFFFFKQKTAYEMRISDWSSDVCSSDLRAAMVAATMHAQATPIGRIAAAVEFPIQPTLEALATLDAAVDGRSARERGTPSKLKILYELRRSLGLGGMIQQ